MKKIELNKEFENEISREDFLRSYNANMPPSFPRATIAAMNRFRETHANLFRHADLWSLGAHRKRLFDWLPGYFTTPKQKTPEAPLSSAESKDSA